MTNEKSPTAETKIGITEPGPASDVALEIPHWPDLTSQFASACQGDIERLIGDSRRFDAGIHLADAKALTLHDAALARAARGAEAVAERKATAISLARRIGALFEELYNLVDQDGVARVFDAIAECARKSDLPARPRPLFVVLSAFADSAVDHRVGFAALNIVSHSTPLAVVGRSKLDGGLPVIALRDAAEKACTPRPSQEAPSGALP